VNELLSPIPDSLQNHDTPNWKGFFNQIKEEDLQHQFQMNSKIKLSEEEDQVYSANYPMRVWHEFLSAIDTRIFNDFNFSMHGVLSKESSELKKAVKNLLLPLEILHLLQDAMQKQRLLPIWFEGYYSLAKRIYDEVDDRGLLFSDYKDVRELYCETKADNFEEETDDDDYYSYHEEENYDDVDEPEVLEYLNAVFWSVIPSSRRVWISSRSNCSASCLEIRSSGGVCHPRGPFPHDSSRKSFNLFAWPIVLSLASQSKCNKNCWH
jgi:hypothetical protein